jgi:hypothetical protein
MTEQTATYNVAMKRDSDGQFIPKEYGEKKLRSMKLSDHAWDTLETMARERNISRTDVIEELTRQRLNPVDKQAIVKEALQEFIQYKQDAYGKHNMQRDKQFTMDARTWDVFREFLKLVNSLPEKLKLSR